ncbi:glycosyltransferase family 25 protein [Roseovarius rhodophyticola]|uniref:Glycosyltransferase family 25 protein n=1 Tax=Roseovarius rhodophyticola TaxID=3080827 RepID=A0ABZ2THS8_9RHOB|nr:glycosyltransferase family 25 protein [Roseovarius sp. W115]MDV2929546.1 glycosyltransferase family 25 protein [Roseovarius sp. W115]
MTIHVFVLHLVRATARRENAQGLLQDAKDIGGFDGEIWPAVDGSALSDTDLEGALGVERFEPSYPFTLKTGEIGCFLSHRQIWAEMQTRDEDAALIIEDDADIDAASFSKAVDLAKQHIQTLGYIQFQTRPPKGHAHLIDTVGEARLVVPRQAGLRTTAQMVSKATARHLLDRSVAFDRPVDTFVQSHWHTGLRPAIIYPSGIQDIADRLDGSTIQSGKKPLMEKLGRELSRKRYRSAVARLSRQSMAPSEGGLKDGA